MTQRHRTPEPAHPAGHAEIIRNNPKLQALYQQDEAHAMGLPMPPVAERFERLEDTLRLAQQMWSGDPAPFLGRHDRLDGPIGSPLPLTRPHPPIVIGGMGEQKTLRLVATYADACNLFDVPDDGATIRRKLDVLKRHCDQAGRPYEQIEKTVSTRLELDETVDHFIQHCTALATLGIQHAVVITTGPWTRKAIATLATAVPRLNHA